MPTRPRPGFASFETDPGPAFLDADGEIDFVALRDSQDFRGLRERALRFVLPATAFFLVWYLTYVILSAYAPGFMGTPVFGAVNIGLLLGMLQFVSTVVITLLYGRYARRHIDPGVDAVRALVEPR